LELTKDGKTLLVGDTHGSVIGLDISKLIHGIPSPSKDARIGTKAHLEFCRKLVPLRLSFSGIMGAIRSIAVTDDTVYVATAGRYAYAFDLVSKGKKFHKIFMKQKLTCCLPIESAVVTEGNPVDDKEAVDDDDGDLIHDILDSVDRTDDGEYSSKSKRRRKNRTPKH
jgi:hypothetical protein